jgi:hypothetical protein
VVGIMDCSCVMGESYNPMGVISTSKFKGILVQKCQAHLRLMPVPICSELTPNIISPFEQPIPSTQHIHSFFQPFQPKIPTPPVTESIVSSLHLPKQQSHPNGGVISRVGHQLLDTNSYALADSGVSLSWV